MIKLFENRLEIGNSSQQHYNIHYYVSTLKYNILVQQTLSRREEIMSYFSPYVGL